MTSTAPHVEDDFSSYYEGSLDAARAEAVKVHLESCAQCRADYDEFREALDAISGLHPIPAPPDFPEQVAGTIRRRSGGRFFGRRAFGDRVPYELIAVVALLLAAAVVLMFRFGGTVHDSLKSTTEPTESPDKARQAMPTP